MPADPQYRSAEQNLYAQWDTFLGGLFATLETEPTAERTKTNDEQLQSYRGRVNLELLSMENTLANLMGGKKLGQ